MARLEELGKLKKKSKYLTETRTRTFRLVA
jgi:hypothetical protein